MNFKQIDQQTQSPVGLEGFENRPAFNSCGQTLLPSKQHKVQIQGHRGGFKPENTMASFQQAVQHGIDAIELDVWMTRDNHLIIIHGGDNGELNHHFDLPQIEYIFEKSYEEMQGYDVGDGYRVPTLAQVFDLINKQMLVNIEVKAPHEDEVKAKYDFKKCISQVYELIKNYDAFTHYTVSSFDGDILSELEALNQLNQVEVRYFQLYNFYEHYELPDPALYTKYGHGINISSTKLNKEVIRNCHNKGKLVGVWVNKEAFVEDDKFYEYAIYLEVDFICTDYPLEAIKIREKVQNQQQLSSHSLESFSSFKILSRQNKFIHFTLNSNENKLNLFQTDGQNDGMSSANTQFSDSEKSGFNSDNVQFKLDLEDNQKYFDEENVNPIAKIASNQEIQVSQ
ncbi:glycerophosphoryl diester phosphodiesterase [Stylonychia lemnae]|uniref:Glycerophosphoryl diester phosphodiesterase n=1 Tax=Stylonychia lemnae TaxID=5949 RepID=A0A078AU51_STYLE|nr:glycerophosphoryl diester phosphodiesterase [Stylonychia lemnae]|eukprot:CDW84767.1 glycerophosphoryl diester phosphodiesterase [Stylonychia lemnae]